MNNKRFLLMAVICGTMLAGCASQSIQEGSGAASETTQSAVVDAIAVKEFANFGGCASLRMPGNLAAAAATGTDYEKAGSFTAFSGTSEDAWKHLLNGDLDVIFAYAPSEETVQKLEEQGMHWQEAGTDALVFLTGEQAKTDILSLSKADISAAYRGENESWKGYSSAPMSDSCSLFQKLFGKNLSGVSISEDGKSLTAACPHSAGTLCYTTYLSLKANEQAEDTAMIAVDGVLPDAQTLTQINVSAESTYPLQISYYIACRGDLDENDPAMLFYRWMTSEEGVKWLHEASMAESAVKEDIAIDLSFEEEP